MKIKLSIPWFLPHLSCEEWTGTPDSSVDGVQFFVNTHVDAPDVWMVFDDGVEGDSAYIDHHNIFYMTAEICYPIGRFDDERGKKYLSQFNRLFTMHDILDDRKIHVRPFTGWMINGNHGYSSYLETRRGKNFLTTMPMPEKIADISVICSNKSFTPEHYLRLKFVTKLKEDLGDRLHWYGNGISMLKDKWPGIAPYRYHLAIENRYGHDIISEKLYDSFLGMAHPIYFGAPNVHDYYHEFSVSTINIYDYKQAKAKILDLIESDWAERNLNYLRQAKDRAINRDNWTTRMAQIARNYSVPNIVREQVYLYAYK